jgi:type IVB pilus formation R64 PilN family outer membrane protein
MRQSKIYTALATALLASGCASVNVDSVRKEQAEVSRDASRILDQGMKMAADDSAISVSDGYYIAERHILLNERDLLPPMFYAETSFSQQDPVSLEELFSLVSGEFSVRVEFTDEASKYLESLGEDPAVTEGDISIDDALIDPQVTTISDLISDPLSGVSKGLPGAGTYFVLSHDGNLIELLDKITGKVGLYWGYKNNQVSVFRTKSENFKADISAINETFQSTFSSGAGEENSENQSSVSYNYDDGEMISSTGTGGTFIEAIKSMLSEAGTVQAIPGLNIIMVRDVPPNVKMAGEFIEKVNADATTQIAIRVDIITVADQDSNNFGFDWGAFFNGSSNYGFEFTSSMLNSATSNMKIGFINPTGNFSGSEAFINALRERGVVTTHYRSFAQTSNGVSTPILDEETKDYVASLTTETTDVGVSTQTDIQTAVTGLDMSILPKMTSKNKISMNIRLSLNELEDLEERNFDGNQVQLPRKSSKSSFFSPVLTPGKTYMIGGFSSERHDSTNASITGDEGPFSWLLGGRKESSVKKEQTVILVTPHIIEN